ncbi:MAG: pitrilysin family protein [Bacillota bacterium]
MQAEYTEHYLPNGIRLIIIPTAKFKTITMGLFLHQELRRDLAGINALLPAVLEQGCRLYPDKLTLQRELENLYGADLYADILKTGERHIPTFTFESAHDKYLGESGKLLNQDMFVLSAIVGDPLIENGGFKEEYVTQEKNQLIKEIKALLNDKVAYAYERCMALMCKDEKFGTYKLGHIEDYNNIDAADLFSYYRDIFTHNPIDFYVVGDLDEKRVLEEAAEAFAFSRNESPRSLPEAETAPRVDQVQYIEEEMSVSQAKMVLGFRTYTAYRDKDYCALLVYNGILGAFPHSKLFMKVREEAGLAYYVHSRLERHKGLMIISAGINYEDRQKAQDIIEQQLEDMRSGNISDQELENTRRGLTNRLLSQQDSPTQLVSFHLNGAIGGRVYTPEQLIAEIEAVDREAIQKVAEKVTLDTVYILRPREGGS